ncbi:hypothetical protein [Streptomyces sp. NPDC127072]|uniref:hypothetical protein n=1 Tax=Streptomyces sp. NPDC127072 TaxID=3347129 RepID=UPI00364AA18C
MPYDRQEIWVDFGISGLSKWFHGPWSSEASETELVVAAADWGDGIYAHTLMEDARRLLDSPLEAETIDLAWGVATGRRYVAAGDSDGRDWLRRIIGIALDRIRQDDASYAVPPLAPVRDKELTDAVLAELRAAAPDLEAAITRQDAGAATGVVPALEQVVTDVDPDLGFRLFLRGMKAYLVPVTESRYVRYHELGERFGYNEFVVDDGTLQSVPDPD